MVQPTSFFKTFNTLISAYVTSMTMLFNGMDILAKEILETRPVALKKQSNQKQRLRRTLRFERRKEMLVSQEGNLLTVINVFETKPEQQQELIDQWIRFVEGEVIGEPGMIGAALHRSIDGTRVVNYAQWRSVQDYERFRKKNREQMEARRPLAERVDLHLYEVVYLTERRGG